MSKLPRKAYYVYNYCLQIMGAELTKVGDYTVDKENRQKPLGKGAFGAVYKGKHAKKGFPVAIKQCIVHSDAHGSMAMKEIKNFQKIPHHKHIVRMFDYDYLQNSFWIVMEYCDRGDLEGYMKRYVPDLDRQLKIMYQCACAVAHLHSQEEPIVHRDIKPANVLFKKEDGKEVVKIADFGLTRAMEKGTHKGGLQTQAGTVAFMAPEIIAGTNYDESVDTFAMGLLFLSMINFRVTDEFMFPLAGMPYLLTFLYFIWSSPWLTSFACNNRLQSLCGFGSHNSQW